MKITTGIAIIATGSMLVSGCSRASYETTPVEVKSSKGAVTCQLYTQERTWWDEAIKHPENMRLEEANAVCQAEGERRKALL